MAKASKLSQTLSKFNKGIAITLIIAGFLGLVASFALTVDKIAILEDPDFQPICNLNPVFSCSSVMKSSQSEIFGIPNTLFGVIGYTATIVTGIVLLAGGVLKRWYWQAFVLGQLVAVSFIHWLFYTSVYDLGTICLFCMLTWFSTIPIFWYSLIFALRNNHIVLPAKLRKAGQFVQDHHGDILAGWYVIIVCIILYKFWYYWQTVLLP